MDKSSKWKAKAKSRSVELKRLRQSLRRKQISTDHWRRLYQQLQRSNKSTPLSGHFYSLELIWLAVTMRVCFNASLHTVSGMLRVVSAWRGYRCKAVSVSTIRNWCLRFGLYYLQKPIAAGRYVLIVDESIGIHKERVLVLLAVPIGQICPLQPLRMEEAQVWAVQSRTSWTGAQIAELLKAKQNEPDVHIAYIVSDGGKNLLHGIRQCQIRSIMDCTHVIANCSKRLFQKDEAFNTFIQQMNALRAKWVMSKYSPYLPPALRAKSRFHQLFAVSTWANNILTFWEHLPAQARQGLDFVTQNRTLLATITQLHELIKHFALIFKSAGIQSNSMHRWQQVCKTSNALNDARIDCFIETMNQYLSLQQQILPAESQILCCSDLIESTFGKYKNKGGSKAISDDILHIAAYPASPSLQETQQAMQIVSCKSLQDWKRQYAVPAQPSLNKMIKAKMVTQT